ncbi:MAG: SDR family NAD(P)-dependent oxidoreductase [Candidatus Thiodiazotropha sp.]
MSLNDKAALITGAAGGIGQALCAKFKHANYKVIATDLNEPESLECDKFIAADLKLICRDANYRQQFIDNLQLSKFSLSTLINNAATQILHPTEELSLDDWQDTLDINLLTPFFLTQALLETLESHQGSVVNIGSVHATATKKRFIAYATSKSALTGLTQALAIDLGHRIRINTINPAAVETPMLLDGFKGKEELYQELADMHPLGRIAKPSEIAEVALFLASDSASFITGTTLNVDGGILSRLHDPD